MTRNLDRRVETLFPVQEPKLLDRLTDEILFASLKDNRQARLMDSDGEYRRVVPAEGEEELACQEWLNRRRTGFGS